MVRWTQRSMDPTFDGSMVRWSQRLIDPWFDGPNVRWIHGSMDPTFDRSVVRWTQRWMDLWFNGPNDRWINVSTDPTFNGSNSKCGFNGWPQFRAIYHTFARGQSSGAVWTGGRWTGALILDHQLPPSLISHTDSVDVKHHWINITSFGRLFFRRHSRTTRTCFRKSCQKLPPNLRTGDLFYSPGQSRKFRKPPQNAVKNRDRVWRNEGDWTLKAEIRTRKKFLTMGEACA